MDMRKAVAELKDCAPLTGDDKNDSKYFEAVDMAIKALEMVEKGVVPVDWHNDVYETIQKRYFDLLERTRWIPVSERLPEEGGYVLAVFETCLPFVAMYYSCMKRFSCEGEEANPTHWMPLPEPPQEGNQ